MERLPIILFILLCGISCGRRTPSAVKMQPAVFRPVTPPAGLEEEALAEYMAAHYWDRFDFTDTLFLSRADTMQMLDVFAAYVAQYVRPGNPAPVDSLMRRASVSRPMQTYFRMLARRVLADPNSPLRSDELYIPVLRAAAEGPWLGAAERAGVLRDLRLAMQNRPGQPANDFSCLLPSGTEGTLYGVEAEYTLLLFTDPDCPACRTLRDEIGASPLLNELIERNGMKVLAVYPGGDSDAWRESLSELPASWIRACDKESVIRMKGLYDTKAIPSMYLLDAAKHVLLKDAVGVPDVEAALDRQM